jgi:molybdenum cofactor cytidylyltransferase
MAAAVPDSKPLAVAILSAGESRRMGFPKALLPYRGKTFIEHLLEVTSHRRVGLTRIVLGAHVEEIRKILSDNSGNVVVNEQWQQGQLSSIHAAIRSLPTGETEGLILCPVDHPAISADLIADLIDAFDRTEKLVALPLYRGRRGHPVIFRSSLYDELLGASPELGARQIVWAHPAEVVEIPTDEEGAILNLNDPESFKKIQEQLA